VYKIYKMFARLVLLSTVALFQVSHSLEFGDRFIQWMNDFRIETTDATHKEHVYSNWLSNDKYITEHNSKNSTYTLGHNHLSGLNSEEFSRFLGLSGEPDLKKINVDKIKTKIEEVKCLSGCVKDYDADSKFDTIRCVKDCFGSAHVLSDAPSSVDWVKGGAVTPVKDQGQCGSCWSFSTTGALEGAYYVAHGTLESFSEQQLVDCDNRKNGGKDMGCNGGLMDNAFKWIEKNGGLCTETAYPYTSGTTKTAGTCDTSCSIVADSDITKFVDVPAKSDAAMMSALAQQPVSIAIQADQKDFQLYKSGVFTGSCGTKLDHGVLAVGYGSLDGVDFYMVKNSWGPTWGDNGYIRMGRGSSFNSGAGQCGMLMQASYPIV